MNTINQSITMQSELICLPWEELLSLSQKGKTAQFKALITKLIANLDRVISEQLSTVMQDKHFKKLEASWLDLQLLTEKQVSSRRVKVKILDLSWGMVSDDLNYSFEIKQTALFKRLYANEFDTGGGTPFGLVVIDHKITSDYGEDEDHDDLYTLQLLSELAERSLCPVVLGVDEFFFGDDPNRQLHDNVRVKRILDSRDFLSWQLLRDKASSRFLHLVLPEYLQRRPYQNYAAGFIFTESNYRDNALWGNSAYLLAGNVIQEFERISWFGFLRSYNETGTYGAIIQHDLSLTAKVDIYNEDDGFWAEQGFVPLSSLYLTEQKGFFSNQSVWKASTEELQMLGTLQTNLMACRFGHYIKAQLRDQIGRYDSMEDCKRGLENWLKSYISEVDYGEDSVMARYPLKASEVRIKEDSQDSTRYLCEIMLQPQYQYEMMDAQVLLTTSMPDQAVGGSA